MVNTKYSDDNSRTYPAEFWNKVFEPQTVCKMVLNLRVKLGNISQEHSEVKSDLREVEKELLNIQKAAKKMEARLRKYRKAIEALGFTREDEWS